MSKNGHDEVSPLRKFRKEKGWKLKDAAPKLGVSLSYLSELETGKAKFTVELAQQFERKSKGELKAIVLLGLESAA